ncbi:MAG: M20/M25/M40 family metallo-hydrolase [Oscillospiraceae bacterium]|nr:M20/M25/M40 family metallo-hydrolase [Oscillospiraceae bacterium]
MDVKEVLSKLCSTESVTSDESVISECLKDFFKENTDFFVSDDMKSHSFVKKGKSDKNIMIAAHMDEIGLMITGVHEDGFLSFTPVGGVDPFTLIAQEIEIMSKEKVFGVIGVKPPHLNTKEDSEKSLKISDLHIDTGFIYEKLKDLVSVGDIAYVKKDPIELANNNFSGRALDNKTGLAVMALCAENLKGYNLNHNIYFTATTQEEIGSKGAVTSSYEIKPSLGIIVDVTFGITEDVGEDYGFPLGKGPVIFIGSRIDKQLTKLLQDTFAKYKHEYNIEVGPGTSGTDADVIQLANEGTPCVVIFIPVRYMHSCVEVVNLKDIEALGFMLAMFLKELDDFLWEGIL